MHELVSCSVIIGSWCTAKLPYVPSVLPTDTTYIHECRVMWCS